MQFAYNPNGYRLAPTVEYIGCGITDWPSDGYRQIVGAAIGTQSVVVDGVVGGKSGVLSGAIDIDKLGVGTMVAGYFNMFEGEGLAASKY